MRTSRNGGRTWSRSVVVAHGGSADQVINGAQPLVRPNGTVLRPSPRLRAIPLVGHSIATARSTDGARASSRSGAWRRSRDRLSSSTGCGRRSSSLATSTRAEPCTSGTTARYECVGNEILFARSADGSNWTTPQSLPVSPGRTNEDAFLPALAVATGTRGARAQVAVAYYSMRCLDYLTCSLDAFLVRSGDGGRTWRLPERLNPKTMQLEWLADTNLGRMVGDYISTSFVGLRPIPVLALASAPSAGRFNEAIFASRLSAR